MLTIFVAIAGWSCLLFDNKGQLNLKFWWEYNSFDQNCHWEMCHGFRGESLMRAENICIDCVVSALTWFSSK